MNNKIQEEKTLVVSEVEYNHLKASYRFLDALQEAGVGNWEGYEDAQIIYEQNEGKV